MLRGCARRLRSTLRGASVPRPHRRCRYRGSAHSHNACPFSTTARAAPSAAVPAIPPPARPPVDDPRDWLSTFASHHVPLTAPQRALMAASCAVLGLLDTHRGDMVAALSELTVPASLLRSLHARLCSTEAGRAILSDQPRLTAASTGRLALLPRDSLGGAYHRFLAFHRYSPAARRPPRFLDDAQLAYVLQRYRETHDLWHVLTQCDTSLEGELTQKAFEHAQLALPSALVNVLAGQLRLDGPGRARLRRQGWQWGRRCGAECEWLLAVYWERHWEVGLEEMRQRLRIELAPAAVQGQW